MQNDEHLCLIAVIGVERPDKEPLTVREVRERDGTETHGQKSWKQHALES